jgi:hypothetical protein
MQFYAIEIARFVATHTLHYVLTFHSNKAGLNDWVHENAKAEKAK